MCENKDFCTVKILQYNQHQKCDKVPFIIYPDLQCLIEKTEGCKNNPEN